MPRLEQLLPLLAADPNDAFLRYAVAMEYAKQARHEEALAEFADLARRHPDYVAGYFMAGKTALQKGDRELAKSLYQQGIAAAQRVGDKHAASEMEADLMLLE
jgi:tetratricopeptide (TPR) repeat protein